MPDEDVNHKSWSKFLLFWFQQFVLDEESHTYFIIKLHATNRIKYNGWTVIDGVEITLRQIRDKITWILAGPQIALWQHDFRKRLANAFLELIDEWPSEIDANYRADNDTN